MKHVVIFGASGKVGRMLVEYALADGHEVTAFVHSHPDLPDYPQLHVISGDVNDPADVAQALEGRDAVLSALGSWGAKKKDVLTIAMTNIIPVMQQHGISRIVSLTGSEARAPGDDTGVIHRFAHAALSIVAGGVLHDGERHIELLAASGLDWVVVRSPIMRGSQGEAYQLTDERSRPWVTVRRAAVARAMVDQLADDQYSQRALYIR